LTLKVREELGLKVCFPCFFYSSDKHYRSLSESARRLTLNSEIARELQIKLRRPVSIEETMKHLTRLREKGRKITDFAGSWSVTDEEIKEIKASISEAWKKWKPSEL
jgi:hypothetical protein